MKKTGIFYGSSTGYTADVANRIAKALGVEAKDVYDVANTAPSALGGYDVVLLGSSTWGSGDIQDDFADFLDGIEALALPGVKVAVFGCGDETMGDTFGAAIGKIYDRMKRTGADLTGIFEGYSPDKEFNGLIIDEVNHSDLTDTRIKAWTEMLKA